MWLCKGGKGFMIYDCHLGGDVEGEWLPERSGLVVLFGRSLGVVGTVGVCP